MSCRVPIRAPLCVVALLAGILSFSFCSVEAQVSTNAAAQALSSARDHNERGIALARRGDHAAAVDEFRAALKLQPAYGEAYYNLGMSLEQIGDAESAISAFRSAVRFRPNSAVMHLGLALALAQSSDNKNAASEFRQAIRLDPKSAVSHYNLGLLFAQTDQLQSAVTELHEAIRLNPGMVQARIRLGTVLDSLRRPEEAIAELHLAVKSAPDDPEAHYQLAMAVWSTHDLPGALAEFDSALKLKPDYEQARYNRARVLKEMGRDREASAEMHELAGLHQFRTDLSRVPKILSSAAEHLKQGEPELALKDTDDALKLWKDNPVAYYLAGLAWKQQGKVNEAKENLEHAIQLKPDYAEAYRAWDS